MSQADWEVPRTEEGLQQVLVRLEKCRAENDLSETGNGLLQLSYLVKWVRSDTANPPFERSHELALEALETFRRARDLKGQLRSLVAVSALTDPQTRDGMLSEAQKLAETLGEEDSVAMVIAAKARGLAMSDRNRAQEMHRQALEIYRRTGNKAGQARALFSLSVGPGPSDEKRDFAIEAAKLFRALGDHGEASRCMSLALMNAEEIEPIANLEDMARQGLQDAWSDGNRGQEAHFYQKLTLIAEAKGQPEEADNFRKWAAMIEDADGLSELERWESDVEMTRSIIAMAKTMGNEDGAELFETELKRLEASKPV